jgi:hypothetical protein
MLKNYIEVYFGDHDIEINEIKSVHNQIDDFESSFGEDYFVKRIYVYRLLELVNEEQLSSKLENLVTPKQLLNGSAFKIYVCGDFSWDLDKALTRATYLRYPKDITSSEDDPHLYPEPKTIFGNLPGLSCSLSEGFGGHYILCMFPYSSFEDTPDNRRLIREWNRFYNGSKSRVKISFCLDGETTVVEESEWLIDFDSVGNENHVTISPSKNFVASEPDGTSGKKYVSELKELGWNVSSAQIIIMASAVVWRQDFLPDDPRWTAITTVLDEILLYGDFNEVVNVFQLHKNVDQSKCDLLKILKDAKIIISSYTHSDNYDPHAFNLTSLLRNVDEMIYQVSS